MSTKIMAIVNATPDSYYPPSRLQSECLEIDSELLEADIIDVGGESTRPGADPISLEEELQRVLPVLRAIKDRTALPISIDTRSPKVAEAALQLGASIVNDITGFQNPDMRRLLVEYPAGAAVLMHMRGEPKTMQQSRDPYLKGVVEEVYDFFARQLDLCESEGIARTRIILDPGIGFGKTVEENIELMRGIARFQQLGCRLLYGVSRKSFIGAILQRPVESRLFGTLAAASFLIERSVDILRVHDVRAHKDLIHLLHQLQAGPA